MVLCLVYVLLAVCVWLDGFCVFLLLSLDFVFRAGDVVVWFV